MSGSMTEAEKAVAEVLCRIHNRRVDIAVELEPADFADEARAVVAAVRPLIYREVRDRLTDECDSPQPHIYDTLTACQDCKRAHQLVQDLIDADMADLAEAAALRTTTPE
jgi:hypothetical protein